MRFMPTENGIHQIHIKFNGVHISGSPYRVKVGKVDADPAALHAYGNGLKEIKTGQKTDFIIDTCNAGSGALGVTVDGPSKVAMDCTEVEEGYKVRYTPLVPGDYYISIKYNGYHIVGSPYKVPCTGGYFFLTYNTQFINYFTRTRTTHFYYNHSSLILTENRAWEKINTVYFRRGFGGERCARDKFDRR